MFEQQPKTRREKVQSLATTALAQGQPSSWFEPLYLQAKGDSTQVPWAKNQPHPYLQDWLEQESNVERGKTALVIGCGLGDDAEALAKRGYNVTAFDIAPTAIQWCLQRFPQSSVNYQVGDLFNPHSSWQGKFDLVYECRNIQALPLTVRSQIITTVASFVHPQGKLLMITRYRPDSTPPEGPPWALSEEELSQLKTFNLREHCRDYFIEGEEPPVQQLRLEYRKLETDLK